MVEDIGSYDYYVANTESGFMTGLLASFAKEKTTIYFEDGSADYWIVRKKNASIFKKWSFLNFQCVMMAKLGYFGKGYVHFEPTKYCIKYASVPNELSYNYYKQIVKFELDSNQNETLIKLLERVYPELKKYENVSQDCKLVFTIPLTSDNPYREQYIKKFQSYIETNADEIYLKKHPRDNYKYHFSDNVVFHEISQDIPAELLFSYFRGRKCFMMEPDSLLLSMSAYDIFIEVLYDDDYSKEQSLLFDFSCTREVAESFCKRFAGNKYKIVDLK